MLCVFKICLDFTSLVDTLISHLLHTETRFIRRSLQLSVDEVQIFFD